MATRSALKAEAWPVLTRCVGDDRQRRSFHVIQCSHCDEEGRIPTTRSGQLTPQHVVLAFDRRGWHVGSGSASPKNLCPACNGRRVRPVGGGQTEG